MPKNKTHQIEIKIGIVGGVAKKTLNWANTIFPDFESECGKPSIQSFVTGLIMPNQWKWLVRPDNDRPDQYKFAKKKLIQFAYYVRDWWRGALTSVDKTKACDGHANESFKLVFTSDNVSFIMFANQSLHLI